MKENNKEKESRKGEIGKEKEKIKGRGKKYVIKYLYCLINYFTLFNIRKINNLCLFFI